MTTRTFVTAFGLGATDRSYVVGGLGASLFLVGPPTEIFRSYHLFEDRTFHMYGSRTMQATDRTMNVLVGRTRVLDRSYG